jgi:hypothetical protein
MGEQGVGVRGVSALEDDGSCSKGGGSFSGQVRPLRNTEFNFLLANRVQLYLNMICLETVLWNNLIDQVVGSLESVKGFQLKVSNLRTRVHVS